jgi:SAM-dependent methyltransferase
MTDELMSSNRAMWDEWAVVNANSAMYNLAGFKAGASSQHFPDLDEVGEVRGKTLLHLQCHFGKDSLSWVRRGARVTGMDFSPQAIELACALSAELNLPARFVCCNLYDLPHHLDPAAEQFDVVYTSYGVLTWLPDLRRWAQIAASYVRPGGMFYIAEFHPLANIFSETAFPPQVEFTYFNEGAVEWPVEGSYADRTAQVQARISYEWNYPLGEVVTNLVEAGLQIEFLHEWDFCSYQHLPFLERSPDGRWRLPAGSPRLPLTFSLRARRPQ